MTARITSYDQESWRHDVVKASSDGRYLMLVCKNHPSPVYYFMGKVSILLCADDHVTKALRDEHPDGAWRPR